MITIKPNVLILILHNQMSSELGIISPQSIISTRALMSDEHTPSCRNLQNGGTDAHRLVRSSCPASTNFSSVVDHLKVYIITIIGPHRCHELVQTGNGGLKHAREGIVSIPFVRNYGVVSDDLVCTQRVNGRGQTCLEDYW